MTQINLNMLNKSIHTQRLELRPVRSSDVETLVKLRMNAEVRTFLGGALEENVATQKAIDHINKDGYFIVTEVQSNTILGLCSVEPYRTGDFEVSYEFFPEAHGHGYGREAVSAIIAWGFRYFNINRIIAVTQQVNTKSRLLLEHVGMSAEETFTEHGEPRVLYSISS